MVNLLGSGTAVRCPEVSYEDLRALVEVDEAAAIDSSVTETCNNRIIMKMRKIQ